MATILYQLLKIKDATDVSILLGVMVMTVILLTNNLFLKNSCLNDYSILNTTLTIIEEKQSNIAFRNNAVISFINYCMQLIYENILINIK